MLTQLRSRPPLAAVLAACVVATGAAGCGSSGSGNADADPAAVAPAASSLYLEAVVRPQGDQRTRLDALLSKIAQGQDVGALIRGAVDRAGRRQGFTYARDVEPWLGNRVALYLSGFRAASGVGSRPTADGAIIVAAKDTGKAQDAIDRLSKNKPKQTYRDVSYVQSGNGVIGVVGDYVVGGTIAGFRQVVDASSGNGPSLGDSGDFKRAQGLIASGSLGTFYMQPGRLVGTLVNARGGASAALLGPAFSQLQGTTIGAAVRALDGGFEFEAASVGGHAAQAQAGVPAGNAPAALQSLPGDSWLGVGVGNIGARALQALRQLGRAGSTNGFDLDALLRQARTLTGIDVPHDLLSWMGDGAIFVRGTTRSSLAGALVVHSTNPGLTRRAIGEVAAYLRRARSSTRVTSLRGVPNASGVTVRTAKGQEIVLAIRGSRFVIAQRRAALDVLAGRASAVGTLGTQPRFRSAAASLGGLRPAFYLDVRRAVDLAQSTSGSSPGFRRALPYLRAFTSIVAGGARERGVSRVRMVLGVR